MRIDSLLKYRNIPIINKFITRYILLLGVDLPLSVKLGSNVSFPHNSIGTVIHNDTIIGNNVKIYQNVTIGRGNIWESPSPDFDGFLIENNVILCSGSKILCTHGKRIIGENSIVAANAVVVSNVPPNCIVAGIPAKVIRHIDRN